VCVQLYTEYTTNTMMWGGEVVVGDCGGELLTRVEDRQRCRSVVNHIPTLPVREREKI